jgi:hypothetical protein
MSTFCRRPSLRATEAPRFEGTFSGDCAVRSRLPRLMTFLAVLLHARTIDSHALPNIFFTGNA